MIYIDRTLIINEKDNKTATIDKPVVLYKGDKNVEMYLTFENNPYKQKATDPDTTFAQLIIHRPNADPIFSPVTGLSKSRSLFVITGDMIDELKEVGEYDFQVRLINADQTSRITLPPVHAGILIREPICEEDAGATGTINEGEINNSRLKPRQFNETLEVLDADGNYVPVEWQDKDIITDIRMNHLEQGLYQISINKADKVHDHNDLYYTKPEIDQFIADIEQNITDTKDAITAETDQKINDAVTTVTEETDQKIADTKAELEQNIEDTANTITAETDQKVADTKAELEQNITDTADAITAETEQKIADTKAELEQNINDAVANITAETDQKIADTKAELEQNIEDTATNITEATDQKVADTKAELEQNIIDTATAITEETDQKISDTKDAITAETDQKISDTKAELEQNIEDTKIAITEETDQKIADTKAEIEQTIEEVLGEVSDILDEIIGG